MATINFLYRSSKPESTLTLRLLFGKEQIDSRTKYLVAKNYWDKYHNKQRIKDAEMKVFQATTRNELHNLERHVLNSFYKTSEDRINKEWLAKCIKDFYQPHIDSNILSDLLIPSLESYIDFKGGDLKESTKKKYRVVKQLLLRFQSDSGNTLNIKDVNLTFKRDFENFCLDHKYATNTISKALKIVKTICNHARKRGLPVSSELDEVKLKAVDTETIYLTPEDLKKIENLTDIPEYLDNARDWLLISCYTGQRISDFMRFHSGMITVDNTEIGKEVKLLEFVQSKTSSPITLPMGAKVIKILNKRGGEFPRQIKDQVYNRFVKDVCRLAGLTYMVEGSKKVIVSLQDKKWRKKVGKYEKWELVTSHIGRRTFATNNFNKIPTFFLVKATGHKSQKMFLKYMRKNDRDIAMEMVKYFQD